MFRQPVIWIPRANRIDSTWVSTIDCVWDGPQWLKSKQCLKFELYIELEHLFKLSLRVPDASQIDIIDDLLMLKSHSGDQNALRSEYTAYTQLNTGTASAPYQVTSVEDSACAGDFQSITAMEAYKKQSFEVMGSCH